MGTAVPVVVVALRKAGSNLMALLMERAGWEVSGHGIRASYDALRSATRQELVRLGPAGALVGPGEDQRLQWQSAMLYRRFVTDLDANEGQALFVHTLPLIEELKFSLRDRRPRLIFLHRDPRARLWSLVRYLLGEAQEPASDSVSASAHTEALRNQPDQAGVWRYAARHLAGIAELYDAHAWMLHHPAVVSVSFRELVGARGGGEKAVQVAAIQRVLDHLGVSTVPPELASSLYNPNARTFRSGSVDEWRENIPACVADDLRSRWSETLDEYGYAR